MLNVVFFETAPSGTFNLIFPSEEVKLPPSLPIFISAFSPLGFPISVITGLGVVLTILSWADPMIVIKGKTMDKVFFMCIFYIFLFVTCLPVGRQGIRHKIFIAGWYNSSKMLWLISCLIFNGNYFRVISSSLLLMRNTEGP